MKIFLLITLLIVGLFLIIKGGDFFVDASIWIGKVCKIPKLIIGATIVSLATTVPELLVSVIAAAQGKVDMAIGNAVGTVSFNTAIIMSISIFFLPMTVIRKDYFLKSMLFLLAAGLVVVCGVFGKVNLIMSLALIVLFIIFMVDNILQAKKNIEKEKKKEDQENKDRSKPTRKEIAVYIFKFVLGAAAIAYGANLMVENASELARVVGVSERIISITILAIGTSLPELTTTLVALIKKQSEISIGNIIGANIIDLTLILPLCAIVSGKSLPVVGLNVVIDLFICFILGMMLIVPMIFTKKLKRWQGASLVVAYSLYMILTCFVF